jgi:2-polyprenyl-3-methyl-5-hydroxy-6-metoxy-1,4-benzoquinol methylase
MAYVEPTRVNRRVSPLTSRSSELRTHARCWLCGAEWDGTYWTARDTDRAYNYRYLRCARCGLIAVTPQLRDPALGLRPDEHFNYVNDIDAYSSSVSVEGFLYLLNKLEDVWYGAGNYAPGSLLEIGCAAGYLLSGARARKWHVTGIEPSECMARWARQYLQLPVECGFFEDVPVADASFDFVVAIETLEHVQDPLGFVETIYRKLRTEGWVMLTTPNVESPRYVPPATRGSIFQPLDHLNLFSTTSLRQLLARCGFKNIRIDRDGPQHLQLQVFAQKTNRREWLPRLAVGYRWRRLAALANRASYAYRREGLTTCLRKAYQRLANLPR